MEIASFIKKKNIQKARDIHMVPTLQQFPMWDTNLPYPYYVTVICGIIKTHHKKLYMGKLS